MPRLTPGSPESIYAAPVGPGIANINQLDFTPQGIIDVLRGDQSKGLTLGAMTSAPSFTASPTFQDRTESLVGLNAPFKGAQQITRTDVTLEVELAELNNANLKYLHPGLDTLDWMSAAHGFLEIGTGNAKFRVTAREAGVAGNSVTITLTAAAGASAPTTVGVVGSAITVTLGTGTVAGTENATALEVIEAINGSAAAKALVQAGLVTGSDGTGVVAEAASAPLAGGVVGSKIGTVLEPRGYVSNSDYLDNMLLALEGPNVNVMQLYVLYNVISTDELSFQPDDEGGIASISATFTGHVTKAELDLTTGQYRPPYKIYNLDVPAVA